MYSEADTRSKFIDPQLFAQGWQETQIIRERYFTDGRKLPGNKRAKQCYVDYLLKDYGQNLAIIEAKKWGLTATEGLEQVKEYGRKLKVRRVYSTNGQEIYEFDLEEGLGSIIDHYPSPEELYERYMNNSATIKQKILAVPYYIDSAKKPRYYQDLAITKALTAIAEGKERVLLTLATGTGKTYIAFQLVYKLLWAKWSRNGWNRRPRILFLADRNILIGQALNNFNPLDNDCIHITGKKIKKSLGKVPTNGNIFFAIYQAIIAGEDEEDNWSIEKEININETETGYYRQYDPDFFDLIIIDECHRGGAKENGNRSEILKYFANAVQLGMTATPKRDDNRDTYNYFWNPVYEYSLKEGINDGFLTPYKVKRIKTNIDEIVMDARVEVIRGEATKDLYEMSDFERNIVIPERTELIAQAILDNINPHEKTIIFCVDQAHAAMMRDAINQHKTIRDADYCVRITSNEGEIGRNYLERFQDNDKTLPTIVTSSQMLTTGVDARNVRNIVLTRTIGSMTDFKQIIGRGTRVYEGKDYFTIIDFTGASNLFYDPSWDGEALENIADPIDPPEETFNPPKEPGTGWGGTEGPIGPRPQKLHVRLADKRELRIIDIQTRYIGGDGKPMTADEYLRSLLEKLPELYQDEEQLRTLWADPMTREKLLKQLEEIWIDNEQFDILKKMCDAPESDIFDILVYLSYGEATKTKTERVQRAKDHSELLQNAPLPAQDFLEYVLSYYEVNGSRELVQSKLGEIIKLYAGNHSNLIEITRQLGGKETLMGAWKGIQEELFRI